MQVSSRLYPDSASSDRLITGDEQDSVHPTKKEYTRGEMHENRAECFPPITRSMANGIGVSQLTEK
jgi:hypothetical protein